MLLTTGLPTKRRRDRFDKGFRISTASASSIRFFAKSSEVRLGQEVRCSTSERVLRRLDERLRVRRRGRQERFSAVVMSFCERSRFSSSVKLFRPWMRLIMFCPKYRQRNSDSFPKPSIVSIALHSRYSVRRPVYSCGVAGRVIRHSARGNASRRLLGRHIV